MINELYLLQDGCPFDPVITSAFKLETAMYETRNGISIAAFVGFIVIDQSVLFSVPKHFCDYEKIKHYYQYSEIKLLKDDLRTVVDVLQNYNKAYGNLQALGMNGFPLKNFLRIVEYYNKYGLHKIEYTSYLGSHSGKINWKRTIQSQNKIISNYNLIFLPFVIQSKKLTDDFITNAMIYSINVIYKSLSFYFEKPLRINKSIDYRQFEKKDYVISELKRIRQIHFKDISIKLIDDLIEFFKWESDKNKQICFFTLSFNSIWEKMVHNHLNKSLYEVEMNSSELIFSSGCSNFTFNKKFMNVGKSENRIRSIDIDHFFSNDTITLIFDSKYYEEVIDLDYKQASYIYFCQKYSKIENEKVENIQDSLLINNIISGLMLPTSKNSYKLIHLDRREIDGLIIFEYYFNMKHTMNLFLQY